MVKLGPEDFPPLSHASLSQIWTAFKNDSRRLTAGVSVNKVDSVRETILHATHPALKTYKGSSQLLA
jgi:hypothetical protein